MWEVVSTSHIVRSYYFMISGQNGEWWRHHEALRLSCKSPHFSVCAYVSLILKAGKEARCTYMHVFVNIRRVSFRRSVEIAGNESLDYCISAGQRQIIEAKWDWQDPSELRRMGRRKRPKWPSQLDSLFLPSRVDDANVDEVVGTGGCGRRLFVWCYVVVHLLTGTPAGFSGRL